MKLTTTLKILFLFLFTTIFYTCDKDDNEPIQEESSINTSSVANNEEVDRLNNVLATETLTTNFSIFVSDEENKPITNASIKIGSENVTTNDNGFALIENVKVNSEHQLIKTVNKDYIPSLKTITPSKNGVTNVSITLLKPSFVESFSAIKGATIANDDITIIFPAKAIANENGSFYNGDVKATVTYYDPNSTTFNATIPGILVGLDASNSLKALISKGMIRVDLTDSSGNELEIYEGKEVTIIMPANDNDPAIIPFWHLNEEKGIWVETGIATKKEGKYTTTVKHFSTYNLDVSVESIDFGVVLKNNNGNYISNQKAILTATINNDSYGVLIKTDNKGEFKIVKAPKGATYSLEVITGCESIKASIGIINENTTKELSIKISNPNLRQINLKGSLKSCNDEKWKNKAFIITLYNGNQTDEIIAFSDNEGKFSISKLLCNYNKTTTYKGEIKVFDSSDIIVIDNNFNFNNDFTTKDITVCNGNGSIVKEYIYNGNVSLNTDKEYQEFIKKEYTSITGDLFIKGLSNQNLNELKSLTSIGGLLYIQLNKNLTSLEGLNNLTSIKGKAIQILVKS
ncbi:hypothetical protein PG913_03705 [Tenacibaculum pacificus]|uniref:hypothetical protein n=1 Tax=Tenacibaculum pacificus TaxID=3018314 RepID=UPI0022F3CE86|nr:hypothetical protein [Tenacibaculum pacificus]WBX74320.1 hypothetical protein PG913_03705 [Tenacibaculum pacificus]